MSWARINDNMPENEKIEALSDASFRVYVEAICYAARNLTDGRLPVREASKIMGRRARIVLPQLLPHLWHEAGDHCGSEFCKELACLERGVYLIHNYLEYSPTREKVEKDKAANHENKVRGGKASAAARQQNT